MGSSTDEGSAYTILITRETHQQLCLLKGELSLFAANR